MKRTPEIVKSLVAAAALVAGLNAQPARADGIDTRPAVDAGLCGDGALDAAEQCDPGADPACDARCTPDEYPAPRGQASIVGAVPEQQSDRIMFTVDDDARFEAHTHDGMGGCPADTTLTLRRGDAIVAFDDDGGDGLCSAMQRPLSPGDYTLEVAGYGGGALPVHITDLEYAVGIAPAQPGRGHVGQGEADRFAFEWPGGPATIAVDDGAGGCPGDAVLTVLGPDGVALGEDDDGGIGLCPTIALDLPTGRNVVVVEGYRGGPVPAFVTRVDGGGPAEPCAVITPEVAATADGVLIASARLSGGCGDSAQVSVSIGGFDRLDVRVEPDIAGHFAVQVPGALLADAAVEMTVAAGDTVAGFDATLQAAVDGGFDVLPERSPIAPLITPEGLDGTWLLTTRDVETGESSAPEAAGVSQTADGYDFWSRCEPERALATATVDGAGITLRGPDGSLLGVGDVTGQRIVVMNETAEAHEVLEAVRIDDIDCEARAVEPRFFTPFHRDSAPADIAGIGLDPWTGFDAVIDEPFRPNGALRPSDALVHEAIDLAPMANAEHLVENVPGLAQVFVPAAGNGMQHLRAAAGSGFRFGPATTSTPSGSAPAASTVCERTDDGSFDGMACPARGAGAPSHQMCTTSRWTDNDVVDLSETIALVGDPNVYPGALLQGAHLSAGAFTPITIPRSGGRFHLAGLSMADPSISVNAVNGADVETARQTLLRRPIDSTSASMSWRSIDVYSYAHLMFELGVDAKWPGGKLEADFDFSRTSTENYVLVKFTQRLYDMVYEPPAVPENAFAWGAAFDDPSQQIGQKNRPVYVGRVGYGRQLFLLVRSKHNRQDIKASLSAAFNDVSGSVKTKANDVLDSADVTFVAYGGDAVQAAQPLAHVNAGRSKVAGAMFAALADVARNSNSLSTSPSNAAAPISYGLYDLITNRPVQLGYSVVYDQRSCVTISQSDYQFALQVDKVNRGLQMWVDHRARSQKGLDIDYIDATQTHRGFGRSTRFALNPIIDRLRTSNGGPVKLTLEHDNSDCFLAYADMHLLIDGKRTAWRYTMPSAGWRTCGTFMESDVYVDPATGSVNISRFRR